MSNNPCYAFTQGNNNAQMFSKDVSCSLWLKTNHVQPHEKQITGPEHRQRRRDIAAGRVEPDARQTWDAEARCWVRVR